MNAAIRIATPSDAADCLAIYRPFVEGTAVSFESELPSLQAFQGRIAEVLQRAPWLVCEAEGRVGGYAYGTRHRPRQAYQWTVETTVYLAESMRGRGLGRALYANLLGCLRLQGFESAVAAIALPNPASVLLHERIGFRPVGVFHSVGFKLGRWHDVGWWELLLQAPPSPARDPLPLAQVLPRWPWVQP